MHDLIDRAAEERAIRNVLQQAVDAWDAGDGNAYAAVFEEDADYITFGGMHTRGREEIASGHQQLFDTVLRASQLKVQLTNLRFLTSDIAVAHVVGGIIDERGQTDIDPTRRSIQTMMLRKADGQWRISASQVTRVQAVAPGLNVPANHPRQ